MITSEIKDNVTYLLRNFPETKDCDLKLVARYWDKFDGFNAGVYFEDIYYGHVTHFESIRRMRQKLQMDNEDLRGLRYKTRKHKLEKEVRELIKND
jgi:hypothetical protein